MRQGSILAFFQPQVGHSASTESSFVPSDLSEARVHQVQERVTNEPTGETAVKEHDTTLTEALGISREFASTKLQDARAALTKVTPSHLDRLKSITATLLPVKYSAKFYAECLEPEKHSVIAFIAMYDCKSVGWIRCKVEPFPDSNNQAYQQIYIQALGILAPFRGLGLASELVKSAINAAPQHGDNITSIYAHVWEKNEDALLWYEKRGFTRVIFQQQYYRRLVPSGAWIVRKEIT